MKNNLIFTKQLFKLALALSWALPAAALAANVLLANKPLVNSSTSDALPNLMFVIDNSGSMGSDFTPDWAGSANPILFKNSAYNTQFYNPNILYTPAVTFDGTSMGNQPANGLAVKNEVTETGAVKNGTTNLAGNANYYAFIPGEYCKSQNLTNCTTATVPTGAYVFPATVRWCNSLAEATALVPAVGNCRAIFAGAFTNLRTPSSTSTTTFSLAAGATVTSIKINGQEIMSAATVATSINSTMASNVKNRINACTNGATGNCQINGYNATAVGAVLTIVSPYGSATLPFPPVVLTSGTLTATTLPFVTRTPGSLAFVNIVTAQTYPLPGSAIAGSERTDCAPAAPCTYAQELTNYGNWWTYYKTRMQGIKSSASLAFKKIDNRYRVGYITIALQTSAGNYLPIDKFDLGAGNQKDKWYTRLFATIPSTSTPLRSALSLVGRIYAGKKPVGTSDPVQYACQANYTLLTTDGYWNTDTAADVKDVNGGAIGDLDADAATRPIYEGGTATSGSLADVAKYYFDTDLRTSALGNCTGALGQNVCGEAAGEEAFVKQHMTTFTLGLGIDGTLIYNGGYKTQTTGDFADIKAGTNNWSNPMLAEDGTRVDDLWHAAVNGDGTYFSAKNPKQLTDSLRAALSDIQSKVGAGSAASASSLQPTAGDNFNYVASYETAKWTGNLEARTVDLVTFQTSQDATWCVENVATDTCASPATLVSEIVNGSSVFYCKSTGSNATACGALPGGVLTGTDCRVEVNSSCTGTMQSKVAAASDTRVIKMNAGGALADFNYGSLTASQKPFFEQTWLSNNLSQWSDLTSGIGSQQEAAVKDGIVNFLRGQTGLENRPSNIADKRIFRYREATLGDITESQPAFISKPNFKYTDAGYSTHLALYTNRAANIYLGSNDGMLHAIDATNGQERWAYVPTPVIPNMWKLADRDYAIGHLNYVNGDPILGEICVSGCATAGAVWKTILVGGLSGGGRGYYALDITDPTTPLLLWEYTANAQSNLGYTFGNPVITKLNDGTWVVLVTSGYNNGNTGNDGTTIYGSVQDKLNQPAGNGQGYLYVLNAATGAVLKTFPTGAGSPTTPSGLAQITVVADSANQNNLARQVYGGDLLGNLWRFDINASSGSAPFKLATLIGSNGAQPITTSPEVGIVNKKRVVFVGTGKYLEVADLSNADKQSLYAIKDADLSPGSELGNPRSSLVQQTINTGGSTRSGSTLNVDFSTGLGWYVDLPDAGERFNIDMLLDNGVLLAPTLVPSSTSCAPGGYGWFNYFNYKNGKPPITASNVVSEKLSAPVVGFNLVFDADGKSIVTAVQANDPTPAKIKNSGVGNGGSTNRTTIFDKNNDNTYGRKSIWRELVR